MAEWFVEAFRSDYLDLYAHRDETDARRALDLLASSLAAIGRAPGRVLDCACGAGRHLALMTEAGYEAVGIDLSRDLLGHGKGQWPEMPAACADMRALPFGDGVFGVVTSLFTSFGYFDDPEEDRRFLNEVARTLAPGGIYFLDFLNAPQVRATLNPRSERTLDDGRRLVETRRIDEASGRVIKEVTCRWPDGRSRDWIESVRLHDRGAVESMMVDAGLRPRCVYGDYDGGPYRVDGPRLIVVAEREIR